MKRRSRAGVSTIDKNLTSARFASIIDQAVSYTATILLHLYTHSRCFVKPVVSLEAGHTQREHITPELSRK